MPLLISGKGILVRRRVWQRPLIAVAAAVTVVFSGAACSNDSSDDGSGEESNGPSSKSTPIDVAALKERLPDDIRNSGRIVVATSAPFAPMEFLRDGKLVGFDVDLADEIAHVLGLTAEIKQVPFPSLLSTVASGDADMGARGLFDTKAREADTDMVTYLRAGTQWARRAGTPIDAYNACGKKVGAEIDTTQLLVELPAKSDACKVVGEPAIDIVTFDSETDAMEGLSRGVVDAVSADSPVTLYASGQSNGAIEAAGHAFDTLPYAFPVAKRSPLGPVLVKVVQHLIDTGEMREVAQRWGIERGVVHTSLLNAAIH